jgi:hypothetical protein
MAGKRSPPCLAVAGTATGRRAERSNNNAHVRTGRGAHHRLAVAGTATNN